jgi:MFS transporter, DHA1 family, inner membrane transport protein
MAAVAADTSLASPRSFNRVHLWLSMVFLAIGFASVAWTRLNIAIILPEVMSGIGVSSLAIGGTLATLSVLGTGFAEPFMGHLSDRIGRRLALTLGLGGFSLFSLLTALSQNLPEMIVVRILLGICQGLFIPTYLAFVGGTFERRRGFSLEALVGMFTIGTSINPVVTRTIFNASGGNWQAPSLIYGLFGLVLAAAVFALGRSGIYDRARSRPADARLAAAAPVGEGWQSQLDRSMLLLVLTMICWGLTQYAYLGLYVTYLRQAQGFTLETATLVASIAGWGAYAAAFLIGWTSDQIGRRNTLLITGTIAAIVSYPLFAFTTSFWPALILAVIFQAANGSFFGLGVAYAQDMARGRGLGGRSGMTTGAGHVMSGLAGGVAATVAATFGFAAVGAQLTLLCIVMVASIFLTVDRAHQARLLERRAPVTQLA